LLLAARTWAVRLGFAIGRRTGRPDRVVLATAHAGRLSGNLALIAAEVRRRGIRPVVLVHQPRRSPAGRLSTLAFHVRAGAAIARARVLVVDDYFFPLYVLRPLSETTVAQVWHACGALKKFGYSVLDKTFGADEELVRSVRIHTNYDLCLVSSEAAIPFYAEAFRVPADAFVAGLGIPRTDLLFGDVEMRAARLRARYGIPDGRRVVLYAPTFRGEGVGSARADGLLDFDVLASALARDHVVLVRLHPFIRSRLDLPDRLRGFVIDVSDAPEINELMLASDVLVTDYSSALFEFALLGRPIAIHAPDLAAYERERDLYIDIRTELPGPVLETTEAVAGWLRAGEVDDAAIEAFARRWFTVADGGATRRFVDRVVEPALRAAQSYLDFLELYDEWDLFSSLSTGDRSRLRHAAERRLRRLRPADFQWRVPVVEVIARR
jgi:CDP-ribitol ribitolphosphotransferase